MIPFKLKKITDVLFFARLLIPFLGISLASCTPPSRPYVPRLPQTQPDMVDQARDAEKQPNTIGEARAADNFDMTQYPYQEKPHVAMKIDPAKITRPAGYRPYRGNQADLREYGEELYKDTRLGTDEKSCNTCHQDYQLFEPSFAQPYPHFVTMAQELASLSQVHLDEMIQLCMVSSMEARPLIWNSRALAALVTYVSKVQHDFREAPCVAENPCEPSQPREVEPSFPNGFEY